MRKLTLILLLLGLYSTFAVTTAIAQNNPINGTWIPVSQELGGQTLPRTAFEKQKLIIADSTYTVIAESVDKGVVKYNGNKVDIYGKEGVNAGKHFTAIYKYDNGQLTLCYNLQGSEYPESFDTKGKPLFFTSIFKKANP